MRLHHKYYRQKNPRRRRQLAGDRAEVHAILMTSLTPRRNPDKYKERAREAMEKMRVSRKAGGAIEAFNLLGELNKRIERGETQYVPLRDTLQAAISGYLDRDTLDYSLAQALQELSAAEVRSVKEVLEIGLVAGEVSPERGQRLREIAMDVPEVRRKRERVRAAERAQRLFQKAVKEGRLGSVAYRYGEPRLEEWEEQERLAREEVGKLAEYIPANRKLFEDVKRKLAKQYRAGTEVFERARHQFPERYREGALTFGYIPPKFSSTAEKEAKRLQEFLDPKTTRARKAALEERILDAVRARFKTAVILEYERLGGKELTKYEKRRQERARGKIREAGAGGFYKVFEETTTGWVWKLAGPDNKVYLEGEAANKAAAGRAANLALDIVMSLISLGDRAGWDNLNPEQRRWLRENQGRIRLSREVARMLLLNINQKRDVKVSRDTAVWIASFAKLGKAEEKVARRRSPTDQCRDMLPGEEIVVKGPRKSSIWVKRLMGNKYNIRVTTETGEQSGTYRVSKCEEVIPKADFIIGAMTGAAKVARAVSNPSALKRLENSAMKKLRTSNPKIPRRPVKPGEIRGLGEVFEIPYDRNDAFKYGYYRGIIAGIDTCGIQNYPKRKRIRKEYERKLLEAEEAFVRTILEEPAGGAV